MKENGVLENLVVVKRSGQRVTFNSVKIAIAIKQAFDSVDEEANNEKKINKVYNQVLDYIVSVYESRKTINVEDIQDIIENTLKKCGYNEVYQRFNEYRLQRAASREAFSVKEQHKFVKAVEKIGLNAKNYQENKPIDLMLNFGKTVSQEFARAYLLESKYNRAHEEGRIYIEDIKSYALKTTSSAIIDLSFIRNTDIAASTLKIIDAINNFKEEQYGEQTIMDLDIIYKDIMIYEFNQKFISNLEMFFKVCGLLEFIDIASLQTKISNEKTMKLDVDNYMDFLKSERSREIFNEVYDITIENILKSLEENITELLTYFNEKTYKIASNKVNISLSHSDCYESNIFKEIYFKVLNKIKNTNITTICKVGDFNYLIDELYNRLDIIVLFLNNNTYSDTIDTLSNSLLINKNINGEDTARGKIKLSTVTINLARLGLKYKIDDMASFYEELDDLLELSKSALVQRYELQASLYKENYNYILNNNILYDTWKLEDKKRVRKVLRNGTLNISFSGLMEACISLLNDTNEKKILDLGLDIVKFMNERIEKYTNDLKLNFVLSEESNNQVNKHLLTLDKTMYGNLDILKKDSYGSISNYINKLDETQKYKYFAKYQSICSYNLVINTNKNKAKIEEELKKASGAKIKVMRLNV